MNYNSVAKRLLDLIGGSDNIKSATHCMTRLRFILKDETKAKDDQIEKMKEVKSVIHQGGQYQIVIGNEVSNLFKEFEKIADLNEKKEQEETEEKEKGTIVQRILGYISGCMTPVLPAMLGTGMLKVILTILTTVGVLSTKGSTYTLIYAVADSFFNFLPIFLGYTVAKKVKGNPMLFMVIGAAVCYPSLLTLMAGNSLKLGTFLGMKCTYLFGIPVICTTYTASVLPMLLMGPIMKRIEDFADKVSPNMVKTFLKPLLFCAICMPIMLFVLGPIGNVVGTGLSQLFAAMYDTCGWITVALIAALMPFIIMTGMHYALLPLCVNSLASLGYDVVVLVTMFCSNMAQGGAALGTAVKSKKVDVKSEGLACGISAIVAGVTEPAMYGINLRYVKPMIGAVIGGGIGGLFCGLVDVRGYSLSGSVSIISLVQFIGGKDPMHGVIFGAIGAAISIGLAFAISYVLFHDEEDETKTTSPDYKEADVKDIEIGQIKEPDKTLTSPLSGQVMSLDKVPDAVFASGVMGKGIAIDPIEGKVVAPCDATVSAVLPSKHAIGLKTENGMELLIHVGLNTVELNGKFFECHVKTGDQVKRGQLLLTFEEEEIKKAGYPLCTPVVINNADDFGEMKIMAHENVAAGETLLYVDDKKKGEKDDI